MIHKAKSFNVGGEVEACLRRNDEKSMEEDSSTSQAPLNKMDPHSNDLTPPFC